MANYATSALKLSDTYVNTLPYNTCSTAAATVAKEVNAGTFSLETGAMVVVKFTVTNTAANPTLNVSSTGAKAIYYNGAAITAGYLKANKVYQFIYNGTQWDLVGEAGVAAESHNHAASAITSGTIAAARLPSASGSAAGITIVYPAASCTTFSSDSGTVTPLAVQKGAKMFGITRPTQRSKTVTDNAIVRWDGTDSEVKDSKIYIQDVTNTKDTTKTANVLCIPAEGGKKMVYGYCTDQIDGTSFIGGVFDEAATEFPYSAGLAIGGTSGNLLWKGKKVHSAAEYNCAYDESTNTVTFS